jgi:hypothetical protein
MAKPGKAERQGSKQKADGSFEDRLSAVERALAELQATCSRIEAELSAVDRKLDPPKVLRAQLTRAQQSLDALIRRAYLDPASAPFPERLTLQRFGLNSQGGEEGILLAILAEAGVTAERFLELGSGRNGGNSGLLARELGWSGLMVDGDPERVTECATRFGSGRVQVIEAWVTAETIDDLLREHGLTGDLDLLSIDIDGNDYWVWEALTVAQPRIVVIEYNALFGASKSVSIPYDPNFRRPPELRGYFGASLEALSRLGRRKGFRLVAVEPSGANAFFVEDGVAPAIPTIQPGEAFRPIRADESIYPFPLSRAPRRTDRPSLFEEIEGRGLGLVEIDESV